MNEINHDNYIAPKEDDFKDWAKFPLYLIYGTDMIVGHGVKYSISLPNMTVPVTQRIYKMMQERIKNGWQFEYKVVNYNKYWAELNKS